MHWFNRISNPFAKSAPEKVDYDCPFCSEKISTIPREDAYCPDCNLSFPTGDDSLRGGYYYGPPSEEAKGSY